MKRFLIAAVSLCLLAAPALGSEGEDLFRQGKYQEAAEAFVKQDMNSPKDALWRYNRGVASYKAGDKEAALSAFASAQVRSKDPEVMFRSAYNMGTVALENQDYETAEKQFKKALALRPDDPDALANLKLALWQKAQVQKQKDQQQDQQDKDGQNQNQDKQEGEDKQSGDQQEQQGQKDQQQDQKDQQQGQNDEQGQKDQAQQENQQQGRQDQQGQQGQAQQEQAGEEKPQNLDGTLEAMQQPPGEQPPQETGEKQQAASMERRKAEALLDNTREDLTLHLRGKTALSSDGKRSGKTW